MASETSDYDSGIEAKELAAELGIPDAWGKINDALCDAFHAGMREASADDLDEHDGYREVEPRSQLHTVVQAAAERAHAEGRVLDERDLHESAAEHR